MELFLNDELIDKEKLFEFFDNEYDFDIEHSIRNGVKKMILYKEEKIFELKVKS